MVCEGYSRELLSLTAPGQLAATLARIAEDIGSTKTGRAFRSEVMRIAVVQR